MRGLRFSLLCAVTLGVTSLAVQAVHGQASATLRTPWGAPDLQGTWDFRTVTPMERPPELAGKATLTEKEAAEYERRMVDQRNADKRHDTTRRRTVNGTAETEDVALAYNDCW